MLRRFQKFQKNKFGNEVSSICAYGFSHRSKLESSVCQLIKLREKAGEIEHIQHEHHVYLTDARIGYVADFKCREIQSGREFFIEAKGYPNMKWPIVKKLWKFYGPGRLEIWEGHWRNPQLTEEITPQVKLEQSTIDN